jgi:RimJ/RimL family protein N-acetyltransferase
MYLRRDAHNDGLGTAMLARLIDLAKTQRLHRVSLHVVADNKPAIHVYEAGGFKLEGVLKDAYFGGDNKYHDELVMGLILP